MSPNKPKIKGTLPGQTHVTGPGGLDAAGFARWYRNESLRQWHGLDIEAISRLAGAIEKAEALAKTVYVLGNGGSAATASHIATDFSKTAMVPGRRGIRCVSLADNAAYITAIGNDLSFDDVFSRQMENLVEEGDMVLMVTGSGNSPNLLKAARLARERKAVTAALLGFDGGQLRAQVDIPILVPSDQYGVIEDFHLGVCHILTFYLKQRR